MHYNFKQRINKLINFFFFPYSFFFILFSFILLHSCSLITNPDKTTISGTVRLEGKTNHSGVTVSLYNLVELDTAIARINKEYPQIGIQISQETEFYHREHTPVKTTTTNKDGKWEIEDADKNNYNIVFEKDDYGFKYLCNFNTETSVPTVRLYRVIELDNNFSGELLANHFYTVKENNDVGISDPVTIDYPFILELEEYASLTLSGDISFKGNNHSNNYIKIYGTGDNTIVIENQADSLVFTNFIVHSIRDYKIKNSANITVQKSDFEDVEYLTITDIKKALFKNVTFRNSNICMIGNLVENFKVEKNIFFKNDKIMELRNASSAFRNNYCLRNNIGVHIKNDNHAIIRNNQFDRNNTATMVITGSAKAVIEKNNFLKIK